MTGIMRRWIDEVQPQVAALVSANPALREEVMKDYAGVVQRELGIKLPFTGYVSERTGPDGAVEYGVVVTALTSDDPPDELAEEFLDLVSGGAGSYTGPFTQSFADPPK